MAVLKQNRSLERGMIVLEALARQRAMSLAELHRETGLPKSTLRRLLATLVSRRFVWRSMSDKLYRAMVTLPDISVSPTPPGMAIVADIGLKHTIDMTAKIGWPSDIQILEKHWMRIVESTRAISPYSLYQGKIDRRINVFASATGLACLTEMAIADVRKMYEDETQGPRFGAVRFGITWEALVARLEESREQGYSVRLLQYTGETVENDNLHAIARPMKKNGMVCGAVSILWPKILMPPADFAAAYLDELIETVAAIEDTLDAHHQSSQ